MDLKSTFTLYNGVQMPRFGLGAYLSEKDEGIHAVSYALQQGYRLVDTASFYGNEKEVGEGVRQSGLPREEVFITTKAWVAELGYEKTKAACEASMERLGVDYIDLYLVHWPALDDWRGGWRAMQELYRQEKVRAIGVSNFPVHLLEEIKASGWMLPMVNQVELHPAYNRPDIRAWCDGNGVAVQAWSPMDRGRYQENAVVREIGVRHDKTVAQVLLRWDLQLGVCTIPKSVKEARIKENADIFDFELSDDEMKTLSGMETGNSSQSVPEGVEE